MGIKPAKNFLWSIIIMMQLNLPLMCYPICCWLTSWFISYAQPYLRLQEHKSVGLFHCVTSNSIFFFFLSLNQTQWSIQRGGLSLSHSNLSPAMFFIPYILLLFCLITHLHRMYGKIDHTCCLITHLHSLCVVWPHIYLRSREGWEEIKNWSLTIIN